MKTCSLFIDNSTIHWLPIELSSHQRAYYFNIRQAESLQLLGHNKSTQYFTIHLDTTLGIRLGKNHSLFMIMLKQENADCVQVNPATVCTRKFLPSLDTVSPSHMQHSLKPVLEITVMRYLVE